MIKEQERGEKRRRKEKREEKRREQKRREVEREKRRIGKDLLSQRILAAALVPPHLRYSPHHLSLLSFIPLFFISPPFFMEGGEIVTRTKLLHIFLFLSLHKIYIDDSITIEGERREEKRKKREGERKEIKVKRGEGRGGRSQIPPGSSEIGSSPGRDFPHKRKCLLFKSVNRLKL